MMNSITYLILLTTEIYFPTVECALEPDTKLEGRLLTRTDSKVLQLVCSTNIPVQLCSVEILLNKSTHDIIRYHDPNCYHSTSLCAPTVCNCSDNCMSFTLNVTITQDMKNQVYSCISKMEKDGVTYFANISVIHDGIGGLKLYDKFIVPHRSVNPTQQATTTSSPGITTVSFHLYSEPFSIAGAAFGFLTVVLLVIGFCKVRYSNSKTETRAEISSISYPKTESKKENSADGDQFGFSEKHTQTDEERFSCFELESRSIEDRTKTFGQEPVEEQQIDFMRRLSQADSGISSIPNTSFHHMPLEKVSETSFIDLDWTSDSTQSASRSSQPETESLVNSKSNRLTLKHGNNCNIFLFESDA